MIKYRANAMFSTGGSVKAIEIDKETKLSVMFDGGREQKITECHSWFDSFEEAKRFQINRAKKRIETLDRELSMAKKWLIKINNMEDGDATTH